MKYGFPYQGSKSKIAEDIINILPPADNFYDLFAGGGAITHCALLSKKWKYVYSNDIQGTMNLFLDAANGKYKNERRWISREQFFAEKDKDHYIRWIWSFGNDGNTYLFGKNIEQIKREAHEYLFTHEYDYTPQKRVELIKEFKNKIKKEDRFELQQLERLQRLQQLQQLQQLERLEISTKDYQDVKIKSNSIIYCDIPYNQKEKLKNKYYGISFDVDRFYEWAKEAEFPVYFSSCFCNDNYFEDVLNKSKQSLLNNTNSHRKKQIIERLYWNRKGKLYLQGNLFV
jgi:16S rRNA G966 N2-methylase RsmD